MIKKEDIDWEALTNPDERFFKVFKIENTPEFHYKINKFKRYLRDKYLYTSDEHRTEEAIESGLANMICGPHVNLYYEIGDFQGLIVFAHILPYHKGDVIFKIWDKKIFSKDFVRACASLANMVMDNFKLRRLTTHSADKKMVRFGEMAGFELEAESPYDMKWNGEFFTNYTLGLVRGKEDE
jgi:hypothetical protein